MAEEAHGAGYLLGVSDDDGEESVAAGLSVCVVDARDDCSTDPPTHGVGLSLVLAGRLLTQLGLACQRPLWRAYQRDGSRVEQWLRREYPSIRAAAKQEEAEIYFEDESRVSSDFRSGKTWALKGATPLVRVTGQRFSLNMISAISPRRVLRFMVVKGGVGA